MTAECLNKGGQCDVLALNFSKAFDKVLHACINITETISLSGASGSILSWLQAFLTDKSQYVIK